MVDKEYDIVGIGNAIVDVISDVDDKFLEQQELRKGLMSLVDLAVSYTHLTLPTIYSV